MFSMGTLSHIYLTEMRLNDLYEFIGRVSTFIYI